MKKALVGILFMMAAPLPMAGRTAAPANDAAAVAAQRDTATLDAAKAAIVGARQPAQGLALLEPLRTKLEADAATRKQRVYSGKTLAQTLSYMLMAAKDKVGAIDVGPNLGQANFWIGFALTDLNRAAEAEPYLARALALSPADPQYLCENAHWHAVRKETAVALDLYQQCFDNAAMAADGEGAHSKAAALRGKGYVMIDLDRLDEAEAAYRASLKIEPDSTVAASELNYIAQQRAHPGRNKS